MSKNNLFLGNARGKVGDVVLRQRLGVQVTSKYQPNVLNPRSESQMTQRTQIANLSNVYRTLKPFIYRAFQYKTAGQSDFNAFVKANLNKTKVYLTKEQAAEHYTIPANYVVASGGLMSVPEASFTAADSAGNPNSVAWVDFLVDGGQYTTIGELSAAILSANSQLSEGAVLTFVMLFKDINADVVRLVAKAEQLVLNTASTDPIAALPWLPGDFGDGFLHINTDSMYYERIPVAGYLVVSHKTDSGLSTSNSRISVFSEEFDVYYTDDAKATAISSYNATADAALLGSSASAS